MKRTLDRTLTAAIAAVLLATNGACDARAQQSPPPAYNVRDEQASWIADPHMRQFYQATVDAFAKGPEHVDRAAYEARSREIFRAMAVSRHMSPEALLDHLVRIPGEMILIVTRDPETLDSFESFMAALFGPQMRSAGPSEAGH